MRDFYRWLWACPFFDYSDKGCIACEGGCSVRLPEPELKAYAEEFCLDNENYKRCSIAKYRNRMYERMDK